MAEETLKPLKLDYSFPPGDTLLEVLEERELAVSKLAQLSGLTEQQIVRLLSGSELLSPSIAQSLETGLAIRAEFWLALEKHWRDFLAKDAKRLKRRSA